MFIGCYAFSTISIKMLNEVYIFTAPWFASFLSSLGFIPCYIIAYSYSDNMDEKSTINPRKWFSLLYMTNSLFASANVILTSIALNYLPGSIVMVLKASSVIMTVIEYTLFYGHKYNIFHWTAVFMIVMAIVLSGCFVSDKRQKSLNWDTRTVLGFACALIASFTQALKKSTIKKISKGGAHTITGMAEGAFCNLLLCCILSLIFGTISGETKNWNGYMVRITSTSGTVLGLIFMASMGLTRGFAFFFQWLIVRNTSATLSQVTTNFRRLL
eukprot:UN24267